MKRGLSKNAGAHLVRACLLSFKFSGLDFRIAGQHRSQQKGFTMSENKSQTSKQSKTKTKDSGTDK